VNISEKTVSFKEIEEIVKQAAFEYGRNIMADVLLDFDESIRDNRDKSIYINKGKKQTVVKTTLGEVTYSRTLYEVRQDGKKVGYVHLLDEAMGLGDGGGHFSELLRDLIVQSCCEGAYRNAARAVSEMTGQTISHAAAWNVVQAVGTKLDAHELHEANLASAGKGKGTIETDVLFEEQDGIYLKLQGADRKKHVDGKEMKVAIAYDGAVKKGKSRYELSNKVACANFEGVEKFVKRKDGVIAGVYNVDEIEMKFLNGDGAPWIKHSKTDDDVHFQLDQFHRNKAVTTYVSDMEARKRITDVMHSNDIDLLLHVIESEALSIADEDEQEKYMKLYNYFSNNKDGMIPIHRRGLKIPPAPEGKEYRNMGCMEGNIFTIIGNRMKGRRACWSIKGGNNLARLLCLKHTQRLFGALESLTTCVLPERYVEEVTVTYSAAKVPQHEGKGYNGFHQVLIPAKQKWLKNLASIKPAYSF